MAISTFPAPSAGGGGVFFKVDVFTSSGTFTAPADVTAVEVVAVGGGGAGGNARNIADIGGGGGGGGGALITRTVAVTSGETFTIIIGAGGTVGTGLLEAGTQGGTTSFGSLVEAIGGGGGNNGAGGASGGGASTTAVNWAGGGGGMGPAFTTGFRDGLNQFTGFRGSVGSFGQPVQTGAFVNANGVAGLNGLAGGGGGTRGDSAIGFGHSGGGNGGSNSGSIAATPGAVNTGGGGGGGGSSSAGTSFFQGANGGSGLMEIKYWSAA